VTVQDHQSSEEEQDEGSLPVHRGASHLRTAENMLSAVGSNLHVQFLTQLNGINVYSESKETRGQT
jgi:hypothetical protein